MNYNNIIIALKNNKLTDDEYTKIINICVSRHSKQPKVIKINFEC
jgi:hypothetical protein